MTAFLCIGSSRLFPISQFLSLDTSAPGGRTIHYVLKCKMAGDSGIQTCSSPENADSRKRPLDTDVEDSTTKKSNCSSGT